MAEKQRVQHDVAGSEQDAVGCAKLPVRKDAKAE
jgi:hypothetical protein